MVLLIDCAAVVICPLNAPFTPETVNEANGGGALAGCWGELVGSSTLIPRASPTTRCWLSIPSNTVLSPKSLMALICEREMATMGSLPPCAPGTSARQTRRHTSTRTTHLGSPHWCILPSTAH